MVVDIWKDPEKGLYLVINHEVLEIEGKEVRFNFKFSKGGKEKHLEHIAEVYDVGPPLNQLNWPTYLSEKDLLESLTASGVKPEEVEKIRKRMYSSARA